jgi:hypothetical protein
MLVEKLEHIRHAAPDDPAVIQSGQRLVLDLEIQTRFHSGPPYQNNPAIPESRRTLINRGAVDAVEQSFSAVSERQMRSNVSQKGL